MGGQQIKHDVNMNIIPNNSILSQDESKHYIQNEDSLYEETDEDPKLNQLVAESLDLRH